MSEIILFHHAQGLTDGMHAFADRLRAAGHTVHLPDLYDGRTFADVQSGVEHAQSIGFGTIVEQGVAAAQDLSAQLVYAGFSLGAMPAQKLAQTRAGAAGVLLFDGCMPASEFGGWPDGLRAQVHGGVDDEWFGEDLEAAKELAAATPTVELFLYEGTEHLFADSALDAYDAGAAGVLLDRVVAFLASLS